MRKLFIIQTSCLIMRTTIESETQVMIVNFPFSNHNVLFSDQPNSRPSKQTTGK